MVRRNSIVAVGPMQPLLDERTLSRVGAAFDDVAVAATTAALVPVDRPLDPRLASELTLAAALARRSLAPATLEAYSDGWDDWVAYARERGVKVLPADPRMVCAYVAHLADPVIDPVTGNLLHGRRSVSAISGALSAINKAHQIAGLPRPGDDPLVREVMAGTARFLGRLVTRRKRPVDVQVMAAMLDALQRGPTITTLVDAVLVHLADRPGVTAARLCRLDWSAVTVADGAVVIDDGNGVLELVARPDDPAACPVRAFAALSERVGGSGPVLVATTAAGETRGHALTPQGLPRRLRRLLSRGDGDPPQGRDLPPLTDEIRTGALEALVRDRLGVVRDRALLLHGWYHARRRSNITAMVWSDMSYVEERGVRVLYRRSKTDPEGRGVTKWLPYNDNPARCPVRAWLAWRDRVAEVLGGDPCDVAGDQAVYVGVDRWQNLNRDRAGRLVALSGQAVADVVKGLVAELGYDPSEWAAHSLRAGWITAAAQAGAKPWEIQRVSDHVDVNTIMNYIREVEDWADNPAARAGL